MAPRKKPERKIGILGFTASRHDAPFDDPEWELFSCNNLPLYLLAEGRRITANFDPHSEETIRSDPEYVAWLQTTDLPVYLDKHYDDFPSSIAFPLRELLDWCEAQGHKPYFTNTISWLVAYALFLGATEVGIWGVDLAQAEEYASQRPSAEYWVGIAEAVTGRRVIIPKTSDLLKCAGLYGWGLSQQTDDFAAKMRQRGEELRARAADVEAQLQQLTAVRQQLAGAIEDNQYVTGVWLQPQGTRNGADPLASDGQELQPTE